MMTTSPTAPSVITTREVEVSGHRLHLNEAGDPSSPAVLWLHGSGPGVTALTNWQALLAGLAPRFHNLGLDLLGFADSAHPDPAPAGMVAYTALLRRAHAGRSRRVGVDEFLGACCVGDGGSAPPASPCGGRRQTTSSCIG